MPRPDPTPPTPGRKADHLRIAAEPGIQHGAGAGLDAVRLRHRALPERDLAAVALDCELLGARLRRAAADLRDDGRDRRGRGVNRRLARAAAEHGVALVLGSGRPLLDDPRAAADLPRARQRRGRRCCSPTSAPRRSRGPQAADARGAAGRAARRRRPLRSTSTRSRRPSSPRASREFSGVLDGHRRGRRAARAAARRGQGGRLRDGPRGRARARRAPASPPSTSPAPAARTGR